MSTAAAAKPESMLGNAFDTRLVRALWPYIRHHWGLLIITALLIPCTIGFELAQPYLLKLAIVDHIAVDRPDGLGALALGFVGLVVLQAASSFAEQWSLQLLGQRVMHDLRVAIYDHVLAQRAAFFDRMPVGRLMTRMTNDIESINEMFATGVITLFADAIKMIAIVVIMLSLDVELTLMTFLSFVLLIPLVNYARRAMRRSFRAIRVRLAAMNAFAQEHLTGIRVVQITGRAGTASQEYDVINADHRDAYRESIFADAAMYALVEMIGVFAVAGVAWWAASTAVASAVATLGLVAVFIEYINKFFIPVRDLSAKYAVMQGAMAAAERIMELLAVDEPDAPRPASPSRAAGSAATTPTADPVAIEFDEVSFSYGAEPILRGASFRVRAGTTVAVVGATGAGKSTLIKLLTRLYEAQAGEIRIGGEDIRSLPVAALRRRVTVVAQDVTLFAGTVADNIALGATVSRSELEAAAKRVGLDRSLERRRGEAASLLDLEVIERGSNFSAGERQLIAFARAMIRDPEVLVLDEATAHVDPEVEELIEQGLTALMRGRTTLVIAHRLSTIRHADEILVMDRGTVIERGNHDQLVAAQGVYAALERTFRRVDH